MQKVIGSLLLTVIIFSSLVAASSTAVGFTIKHEAETQVVLEDNSQNNYGFFVVITVIIFLGIAFLLNSKFKKIKKVPSKKKASSKKR